MGMSIQDVLPGFSFPLGATVQSGGVNFCIYSQHATAVELLLFEAPEDPQPSWTITLDPKQHKTAYYWHVFVPGLGAGQIYAYRVHGPFAPERGLRFDPSKVLLDPYTRAVVNWQNYNREAALQPGDNCPYALRGVVVPSSTASGEERWAIQVSQAGHTVFQDHCLIPTYDWEGDYPPAIPYTKTVIYEMHVGGFTRHPNSGVAPEKRGTYAGLIEKIPYLQELGVTAVELLPIHQFDEQDAPPGLTNYWGYSTVAFFAPHAQYSSCQDPLGPVNEFRDMVKALHRAGIEVILDVVFNHTAEGNHEGPTLSFKGLDNEAYYLLEQDRSLYSNYSGCGNTLKANHHVVGRMILDCLQYWVAEMHVDGFRFDLASVLSRSQTGHPMTDPPILWMIGSDPILVGTKIIAEAWDAAGLYQVGSFPVDRFAEWNGPFRDDVRRFVKGEPGMVSKLAARIMGSPDIYPDPDHETTRSINFVACHDGFTLNDLVSYNTKHNELNLENNRDGANANFSWNCGIEGSSNDPQIEALRLQQIKNFFTILLFSQGTPMLLMGDEIRHTQQGNNNAYCQNDKLTWFDWERVEAEAGLLRFVQGILRFTQSLKIFQQNQILTVTYGSHSPHIIWHGIKLGEPDWGFNSHSLAFSVRCPLEDEHLHIIFNAYWEPLTFELPLLGHGDGWYRIVDTALASPDDFCSTATAPIITAGEYRVAARSSVVFLERPTSLA